MKTIKTLKAILLVNGLSSAATGLLLVLFSKFFAQLFGLTNITPFTAAGIFLLLFSAFVVGTAQRKTASTFGVKLISILDGLWIAVSVGILLKYSAQLTQIGIILITAVALWVGVMLFLQMRWITGNKLTVSGSGLSMLMLFMFSFFGAEVYAQENRSIVSNKPPVEVVQEFLQAVKAKNHAKAVPLMDSLMQWHQPGSNKFSGVKKNATEVFKMFRGFLTDTEGTLTLADVKVTAVNGNEVACHLNWQAFKPGGAALNVDNIDVYTVVNGKIIKAVVYTADAAKEDIFWGK